MRKNRDKKNVAPSASYQDVINALDEMLINKVSRYEIMNLSEQEKQLIASIGQHQ